MSWCFWRWETPKTRRLRQQLREVEAALQGKTDKLTTQVEKRKGLEQALREEIARRLHAQSQVDELHEALAEAARRVDGLHSTLKILAQPTRTDKCDKIQLRDRGEAMRMAEEVERKTRCGNMEPYKCPVCPRHGFTGQYFWHIRHAVREERGLDYSPARMKLNSIGNRVSPVVLANLQRKLNNEGDRKDP